MKREQVDAVLLAWDERFNWRQTRRVATRSINAVRGGAEAVREHLRHIVRRTPQAMLRISGGGKGMGRIRAHLAYIARHGRLALEDQDGERHLGKQDLEWLGYSWQAGGVPIAEVSDRREALNIVLSMPAGTDAHGLQEAARAFAAAEFAGHQYVMALHTLDGDPSRHAAPHPHVHLCVKMAGDDARRLNPRKHDLRRWREDFAERLREHGIDAAASSRLQRFQRQRGRKQSLLHLQVRGTATRIVEAVVDSGRRAKAQLQERAMRQGYGMLAEVLAVSEQDEDRALARGVGMLANTERDAARPQQRHRESGRGER